MDGAPPETLVARLSRAQLEQLVLAAIAAGRLPVDSVTELLADDQRKRVRPAVEIRECSLLVTEGPFKDLDVDLTLRILSMLDATTRLVCVSQVCKGWRSLRCHPTLWRSVAINCETPDSWQSRMAQGGAQLMSEKGAAAFLTGSHRSPIADPGTVEELAITGRQASAALYKKALQACCNVRRLYLCGKKKLSPDVFVHVAKTLGSTLQSLRLGEHPSKVTWRDITTVAACAPHLSELVLEDMEATHEFILALGLAAEAARNGGKSLIRVFHTTSTFPSGGAFSATALPNLGAALPELEHLAIRQLSHLPIAALSSSTTTTIAEGVRGCPTAGYLLAPFAPLLRLRHVAIHRVERPWSGEQITASHLQWLVVRLAAAAPLLEHLLIEGLNERWDDKSEAEPKQVPLGHALAAACAGPCAAPPPAAPLQHLRVLRLSMVAFQADCFLGVTLPSLAHLHLRDCAAAGLAAAGAAAAAPRLSSLVLHKCAGLDGLADMESSSLTRLVLTGLTGLAEQLLPALSAWLSGLPTRAPALTSLVISSSEFLGSTWRPEELENLYTPPRPGAPPHGSTTHASAASLLRAVPAAAAADGAGGSKHSSRVLFDARCPWPQLRSLLLDLPSIPDAALPALLAGLAAPKLRRLLLPSNRLLNYPPLYAATAGDPAAPPYSGADAARVGAEESPEGAGAQQQRRPRDPWPVAFPEACWPPRPPPAHADSCAFFSDGPHTGSVKAYEAALKDRRCPLLLPPVVVGARGEGR